MKNQKEAIQNLLQVLSISCQMEQWQIARDTLGALAPYGFTYKEEDGYAVFAISGTVCRVPLSAEKSEAMNVPDFTTLLLQNEADASSEYMIEDAPQNLNSEDETKDNILNGELPADGLLASILKDIDDFAAKPIMQMKENAGKVPDLQGDAPTVAPTVADEFGGMFHTSGGLDELEELERMYGSGKKGEEKESSDFFPERGVTPEKPAASEEHEQAETGTDSASVQADDLFPGFSRIDADGIPEKTPTFRSRRPDRPGETEQGFQPPLTSEIENNFSIPLLDCVYSIFLADVYEEQAINKQKIFFMVAPFEVTKDSPSTNILFYAYTDHVPYCTTSLKNHEKNSLVCQIGQFQFLVRGSILDGKWQAEVKLTGESLRRGDILEIKQVKHFSPDSLGQTNGHIRFRYKGYINRPDLMSTGCINIFPIDPNTKDCVVVRCMEDFIDYVFTDQKKELKLQTAEHGIKQLHVTCENDTLQATFSDYVEVEEGELTT